MQFHIHVFTGDAMLALFAAWILLDKLPTARLLRLRDHALRMARVLVSSSPSPRHSSLPAVGPNPGDTTGRRVIGVYTFQPRHFAARIEVIHRLRERRMFFFGARVHASCHARRQCARSTLLETRLGDGRDALERWIWRHIEGKYRCGEEDHNGAWS